MHNIYIYKCVYYTYIYRVFKHKPDCKNELFRRYYVNETGGVPEDMKQLYIAVAEKIALLKDTDVTELLDKLSKRPSAEKTRAWLTHQIEYILGDIEVAKPTKKKVAKLRAKIGLDATPQSARRKRRRASKLSTSLTSSSQEVSISDDRSDAGDDGHVHENAAEQGEVDSDSDEEFQAASGVNKRAKLMSDSSSSSSSSSALATTTHHPLDTSGTSLAVRSSSSSSSSSSSALVTTPNPPPSNSDTCLEVRSSSSSSSSSNALVTSVQHKPAPVTKSVPKGKTKAAASTGGSKSRLPGMHSVPELPEEAEDKVAVSGPRKVPVVRSAAERLAEIRYAEDAIMDEKVTAIEHLVNFHVLLWHAGMPQDSMMLTNPYEAQLKRKLPKQSPLPTHQATFDEHYKLVPHTNCKLEVLKEQQVPELYVAIYQQGTSTKTWRYFFTHSPQSDSSPAMCMQLEVNPYHMACMVWGGVDQWSRSSRAHWRYRVLQLAQIVDFIVIAKPFYTGGDGGRLEGFYDIERLQFSPSDKQVKPFLERVVNAQDEIGYYHKAAGSWSIDVSLTTAKQLYKRYRAMCTEGNNYNIYICILVYIYNIVLYCIQETWRSRMQTSRATRTASCRQRSPPLRRSRRERSSSWELRGQQLGSGSSSARAPACCGLAHLDSLPLVRCTRH